MDAKKELEFMTAKLDLLCRAAPEHAQSLDTTKKILETMMAKPNKRRLRSLEGDLHDRFTPFNWEPINRELKNRFGFTRLGNDPIEVARRVLKRGRIRTLKEGEIVRDFVSNQGNESELGTEEFGRLAYLYDAWEAGLIKRRRG